MHAPADRNRLPDTASPYLAAHADNPVHWQPWDATARQAAADRDVPIFLSVGYAACHWCQVMESESFENPEIAGVLNETSVPVKVDRQEHPGLDLLYQRLAQITAGSGGWPLSVWLTPDGRPFSVGTYYPATEQYGRPAFSDVINRVEETWRTQRAEVEERADAWTDRLRDAFDPPPPVHLDRPLEHVVGAAVEAADRQHGGWGNRTKFPSPSRLFTLLVASTWGREDAAAVAKEALDAMADGGIYDHLGGGFHRYATDREWHVPHFEKMLYDNVELARCYAVAADLFDADRYATVAEETLAFLERELSAAAGGFYSTLDARSPLPEGDPDADPVEGAYYTWTPADIEAVTDVSWERSALQQRYGITAVGDVEGRSVLRRATTIDTVAESVGRSPATVRDALGRLRDDLHAHRDNRPRPRRDEQVIAGWNGLAVRTFATGATLLADDRLATRAQEALAFVRDHLWDETEERLHRRTVDGDAEHPGVLADYAFVGLGALALNRHVDAPEARQFAVALADAIDRQFFDDAAEVLYYTAAEAPDLLVRPIEFADRSVPSSQGAAATFLAAVSAHVEHDRFARIADAVLTRAGSRIEEAPQAHATLARVAVPETGVATTPAAWPDRPDGL